MLSLSFSKFRDVCSNMKTGHMFFSDGPCTSVVYYPVPLCEVLVSVVRMCVLESEDRIIPKTLHSGPLHHTA